jgi:ABC-type transporter Mla maintaining outer membrane lipid asymmetry permease subunit MlaE
MRTTKILFAFIIVSPLYFFVVVILVPLQGPFFVTVKFVPLQDSNFEQAYQQTLRHNKSIALFKISTIPQP